MNAVLGYFHHLLVDAPERWHPLLSVYYLTYSCALRCPHCCDGAGVPYPQLPDKALGAERVLQLLAIIRRHCEFLVLTGGEPLQHPDFSDIAKRIKALRFRGVILTTNGVNLEPHLHAIAESVHFLVFSLQTLDSGKADAWYGGGGGVHQRVLANIEKARQFRKRRFEIIISSVVTPQNIADLYDVWDYARARGFRLAACPQLVGVKAHAALAGSSGYRAFFDFLIAEKRKGGRLQGTVDYLEHMRDLRKFACRPFTMLTVSPSGDVLYPCLELGQVAGNLFDEPNLHALRRAGLRKFGPQPDCDTRCHSACALGFSRLLANPASALHEAMLEARGWLRNFP
ncbi:MAG TPA: radical SAM protein [Verrucomicrobiae bacterium]